MKKRNLITLFLGAAVTAGAQKLPSVQKESVRAPVNIKIDGKASEWNNIFKAQNNATELLYTISNDDENLYLTAQVKHKDIIDKIVRGGITFTVNPGLAKKSNEQVSVTYPDADFNNISKITNLLALKNYPEANKDVAPASYNDINKAFVAAAKTISVKGFKNINNGDQSIYNEGGIKVASNFDDDHGYTYELAIPLKLLSLSDTNNPFSYQIKVNEPKAATPKAVGGLAPPPPMMKTAVAATDAWGEYILAKK